MFIVFGRRFRLDSEQAREDQIQLIGIEAGVFDDLADLESNSNVRWSKRLASLISHQSLTRLAK